LYDRLRGWLAEHPVAAFVLLAFGISYLVGWPALMAATGAIPVRDQLLRGYLPRVLVVYGPALAALLLARNATTNGPAMLLRRVPPSRADVPVAAAVVVASGVASAIALYVAGTSVSELSRSVRADAGLLVAHFALQLAVVACGEELGWRGWLLPQLAARTSRLRAAVGTGMIWGVWHGPLLLGGLGSAAMFLLFVIGVSVLFTWLWVRAGGRLFTVIVAHASVNAPLFFWEQARGGTQEGDERIRRAWVVFQAMGIVAAVVLVLVRWRWWNTNDDGLGLSPSAHGETKSGGESARVDLPIGMQAHSEVATLASGAEVQVCRASVRRADGQIRQILLLLDSRGRELPTLADLQHLTALSPPGGVLAGLLSARSGEVEVVVLPELEDAAEAVAHAAAVCATSWGWDESESIHVTTGDRSWDVVPRFRDGAWVSRLWRRASGFSAERAP